MMTQKMVDNKTNGIVGFLKRLLKPQFRSRQGRCLPGNADRVEGAARPIHACADLESAFKRALECHRRGEVDKARLLYMDIIGQVPAHFDARLLLGALAIQEKQFAIALEHLDIARSSNPGSADVHAAIGDVLGALHRYGEAVASYDHALEIDPENVAVRIHRAWPLHRLARNADALASLESALQRKPDSVEALIRRGNVLVALGRPDAALSSFDQPLQIDAQNAEALNNRGTVLSALGRLHEALGSYDRALQINPRYLDAHNNRGLALSDLRRYDDAMRSYECAMAINPDEPNAQYNQSLCRLLHGEFKRGWLQYEWRWKIEQFRDHVRHFSQPLWRGAESLVDKTILLHAEQGLGDAVQFCRYTSLVGRRGARVFLETPSALTALMSRLDGVEKLITRDEVPAQFDFHCPLLSLPLAFNTTAETIPQWTPYLYADNTYSERWTTRLGECKQCRVGVVWSGNPGHRNDRNRSIPFSMFKELFGAGISFVSLQKELRPSDKPEVERHPSITHFGDALEDFSDTAALIDCMDLVISVDTAVAHLAGAMGKPVWILLPYNPDWRWLLDREDSPWYPTARLFRQSALGDWKSVIENVERALGVFSRSSVPHKRTPSDCC